MAENEMIGWHHQLNGQEFEQIPGDGEGQGSLMCCSPWGCQESDTTERMSMHVMLSTPVFSSPSLSLFLAMLGLLPRGFL